MSSCAARQVEGQDASSGEVGVHHRGDQEVGSGGFGERSAPPDVVGQSGSGAQGEWEVEAVY